jgi:hypothetical protein
MKFGQELLSKENPRFKGHYIAYKQLKKLLKELAGAKKSKAPAASGAGGGDAGAGGGVGGAEAADPTTTAAAARFITELQREMSRINAFVTACQLQLDTERRRIDGEHRHIVWPPLPTIPALAVPLPASTADRRTSRNDVDAQRALVQREREVRPRPARPRPYRTPTAPPPTPHATPRSRSCGTSRQRSATSWR